MCTVEPQVESGLEVDDAGRGERLAAAVVSWGVRLWCLPLLALVWVLGWTAIGVIRGGGVAARWMEAVRGVRVVAGAVHPGACGPRQLGDRGEPMVIGRA
jgi:hypothetical protein